MDNEEQILTALNKMLQLQEQSLAIQKQAFENQQQAIAHQQQAIKNQVNFSRTYRIVILVAVVLIGFLLFKILPYLR